MNIQVVTLSQKKLVCIRHIGPYDQIGSKFEQLWEWTQKYGVSYPHMVGVYYDNPSEIEPSKLRSDAGVEVGADFNLIKGQNWGNEPLHDTIIPFGDYAKYTHHGSYNALGEVWHQFMNVEIPKLGREMLDPTFEIYVNDPGDTPEHDLITELYARLK